MPVQSWVPMHIDLDFVLDRRPRDVRDVLKQGKRWIHLYTVWHRHAHPKPEADHALWDKVVLLHGATGSLTKTLEKVTGAKDRMNDWNRLVGGEFFEACGTLRVWLEEERKRARQQLEQARGPVAWYQRGVSDKDIKARQKENMNAALAAAWADEQRQSMARARAEEKARAEAEAKAKEEAKAREEAKAKEEAKAREEAKAEERARAEAKAPVQVPAKPRTTVQGWTEAEARTRARALAQAEAKVRRRTEARRRAEEQARARAEARAARRARVGLPARAPAAVPAPVPAPPDDSDATLTHVEMALVAYTHTVKPRLDQLLTGLEKLDRRTLAAAHEQLGKAFGALSTAEALLREACDRLRQADSASKPKAEKHVIAVWVTYTQACEKAGRALRRTAKDFDAWAVEDTSKKLREDFDSAYPALSWTLWAIELIVVVLMGLVQTLGYLAAPVAPQVTAVMLTASAGLTAALEAVKQLTVMAVSAADAANPATVRRHLGRTYEQAPDAPDTERLGTAVDVIDRLAGLGSPIASAGMKLQAVQDGSPYGPTAQAAPFVGQIGKITGLVNRGLKMAMEHKELRDTGDRDKLVALHELTTRLRTAPAPGPRAAVLEYPKGGRARIRVNGKAGTLENGRFHQDDRRDALTAALAGWSRWGKADPHPCFTPPDQSYFARIPHFALLLNGRLAQWQEVAEGMVVHEFAEVHGEGYVCQAFASGLGLPPAEAEDRWNVTFFLSYEGKPEFLQADLRWFAVYEKSDPTSMIIARTHDDAIVLDEIRNVDPGLDFLTHVRRAKGLDPQNFELTAEGLAGAGGQQILRMGDVIDLCAHVADAAELREAYEQGQPIDAATWGLGPEVDAILLADWQAPLAHYRRVRNITDEVERWCELERLNARWQDEPQDLVRFLRFVATDDELSTSVERIGRLYDEGPTDSSTGIRAAREQQHLAELADLIHAGEVPREPRNAWIL
ncbi:hypothetical protein [Streptomyces sp. WAC06614]|uniref:hypothetical protein n=1 Tax=Streptomyces sp. WAC06614 TaxID=2487416 RepID=UPI000F76785C|nr:hypothetical protein [Streptomyces sp. WAC06614]RSS81244.1 hypothetical protein EF918_11020 [Streptomyces sp. WAC06614]